MLFSENLLRNLPIIVLWYLFSSFLVKLSKFDFFSYENYWRFLEFCDARIGDTLFNLAQYVCCIPGSAAFCDWFAYVILPTINKNHNIHCFCLCSFPKLKLGPPVWRAYRQTH